MIPFKIYSNLTARLGNGPVVYIDPMGLRNEHLCRLRLFRTRPRTNDSKLPLEELPESNSLQRGMKKFLMSGGMPKEGLGVRKYTRLERK